MIVDKLLTYNGRILLDMAWKDLTLENSWVNYGSGFATAQYYQDIFGRVWVKGVIKNGTTTAGTTIATLPAGFLPPEAIIFPGVISGATACAITVNTNGTITGNGMHATYTAFSISFRTY
jgi:hypothetical protein